MRNKLSPLPHLGRSRGQRSEAEQRGLTRLAIQADQELCGQHRLRDGEVPSGALAALQSRGQRAHARDTKTGKLN